MGRMVMALLLVCVLTGVAMGASVSRETTARVSQLSERATKLSTGKVAEYAKDSLGTAQFTISAAQVAIAAGNEKQALQKAELAELQLSIAEARAAEKEQVEQIALRRAELKKLEAQFERYFQGGDK